MTNNTSKTQTNQTFIERCYKDKHGKVTIWQTPNAPITLWATCRLALMFVPKNGSTLYNFLDIIAFGTLFTWAWLELFNGVNNLRRAAGLIVLIAIINGRI